MNNYHTVKTFSKCPDAVAWTTGMTSAL